jgi:NAD(P)-dependent dehydrogenase (short-subunit alcohol dehydrogenase family)
MRRVHDKVAIVTGGALGIGRATSILLAREGASVAVMDVTDQEAAEVIEEIRAAGGAARAWHLDVGDEDEVRERFAAVATAFGGIHVLVNNAGISGVTGAELVIDGGSTAG